YAFCIVYHIFLFFFFFFQAEDGIRDYKVTGVQTCALPILPLVWPVDEGELALLPLEPELLEPPMLPLWVPLEPDEPLLADLSLRSEERRVGKECRVRWSWYD